ncbi:MAG: PA2169 family four-helix-bundle protein [Terriglobales bacterium]
MANQKYVVDALEDLIAVARDGQNGYRDGAEHAKDPQLRRFMDSVSLARAKFAGDLESYAVRLGKRDVDRSGSVKDAIQRGWTDLEAGLGGGDDSILSSMETGDSYAKHRYQKYANDNKLPDDILETIRIQQQTIAATLDRVRAMRQLRKAA